jgi:glycosyltransferase involved in cell wall biosynthesis
VLPQLLEYQPYAKNIGLFYIENSNIRATGWVSHINLLDEVWVSSNFEKDVLIDSGVDINVEIVPMPINMSKFDTEVEPLDIPELKHTYTFYFIGEYIDRKNLGALVQAFHREFRQSDAVSLVIKTNKGGASPDDLTKKVIEDFNNIKQSMRVYHSNDYYLPEYIITKRLSDNEMLSLHKSCDCFVMPSRGESLNRPLMDAVGMGNETIFTGGTGMDDVGKSLLDRVEYIPSPALTNQPPLPNLYTSYETWNNIDIIHLQECMRESYESRNERTDDSPVSKVRLHTRKQHLNDNFSHEAVAKKMEGLLC